MRVYRLQHKVYGVGPYNGVGKLLRTGQVKRESHLDKVTMSAFLSAKPESDKILTMWEPDIPYDEFEEQGILFGVKSIKDIFNWFYRPYSSHSEIKTGFFGNVLSSKEIKTSTSILQMLVLAGFQIKCYDVPNEHCWVEPDPGIQVAFRFGKANEIVNNSFKTK